MYKLVLLFGCIAAVACNDIKVGTEYGRLVFNESIHASPAFWLQTKNYTVNVTEHEIISRVIVTDQRPVKDGSAKIVEGGKGCKNVTIELQSPSVLRGFDFHIAVYAVEDNMQQTDSINEEVNATKDMSTTQSTKDATPLVTPTEQRPVKNENIPAYLGQQYNKDSNTQQEVIDPVVAVNQDKNTTEGPTTMISEVTSEARSTEAPEISTVSAANFTTTENNLNHPHLLAKTNPLSVIDTTHKVMGTQPSPTKSTMKDDVIINSPMRTQYTHENLQDYDNISKDVGQKVLFGIRRN